MKEPIEHLKTITTEQLQHGDMMATSSLMPAAAADVIAKTFFDFVIKHNLADTMPYMSPEQIQVIALFLSYLQRNLLSVFISVTVWISFNRGSRTHQLMRLPRQRYRILRASRWSRRMVLQSTPTHRDLQCRLQYFVTCAGPDSCRLRISGHTLRKSTTLGQRQERDSSSKSSSELVYHYIQQTSAAWPATSCTTCCTLTRAASLYELANAP